MAAVPSIGRADRAVGVVAPEAKLTQALYERHATQIFRYCLHQLGSREEAEDAVQSTFLNAFRGVKRGVVPENESAWLFKIAENVCLSRRRSTWRRGRVESTADFDVVEELTPAPSRLADELLGLQDVLEQMPESQRRAILLREWQGLSYREIAEELELSQTAVETLIFRARRSLAKGLEQPPEPAQKRRMVRGADLGNLLTGLKSLFLGGSAAAAKVAAVVAVVGAGTVVAGSPAPHARTHVPAARTQAPAAVAPIVPSGIDVHRPAPVRHPRHAAGRVEVSSAPTAVTVPAPAISAPTTQPVAPPPAPSSDEPAAPAAASVVPAPPAPALHAPSAPAPPTPAPPASATPPEATAPDDGGTQSGVSQGQGKGQGNGDLGHGNQGQGQGQSQGNGNGSAGAGQGAGDPGQGSGSTSTPQPPAGGSSTGDGGDGNGNGHGGGGSHGHGH